VYRPIARIPASPATLRRLDPSRPEVPAFAAE